MVPAALALSPGTSTRMARPNAARRFCEMIVGSRRLAARRVRRASALVAQLAAPRARHERQRLAQKRPVRSPPSPARTRARMRTRTRGLGVHPRIFFESEPPRRDQGSSSAEGSPKARRDLDGTAVTGAFRRRRRRTPPRFREGNACRPIFRDRAFRARVSRVFRAREEPRARRASARRVRRHSARGGHAERWAKPRAPPSRATLLQLALRDASMFTHCPTPSAAGGTAPARPCAPGSGPRPGHRPAAPTRPRRAGARAPPPPHPSPPPNAPPAPRAPRRASCLARRRARSSRR